MISRDDSTSASSGANTALAASSCPGWISVLPSKPIWAPWRHSASKPSGSRTSLYTPSRMTFPAARAPSRHRPNPVSSGWRPGTCAACSSLARSLVPITSTVRRSDAAAMLAQSSIAWGVSTMAQILVCSGAPPAWSPASMAATSAGEFTLGTTTAAGPAAAAAARSSACQSVSSPFTRMVSSRLPYSPEVRAATTLSRASALASGATASSRSRISESADSPLAFSSARVLAPGMYSTERRGRRASVLVAPLTGRTPRPRPRRSLPGRPQPGRGRLR